MKKEWKESGEGAEKEMSMEGKSGGLQIRHESERRRLEVKSEAECD